MYLNYSKLWKLLVEKDLSKSDLMELTGLSSRVIAKLAKNETVSTDTIAKICTAMNCDVGDMMQCSSKSELSLYHYNRTFGKIVDETNDMQKSCFIRNGQKFVLYLTKKKASKSTRIDCGEDNTIYRTQYYIAGGHGSPSIVKTPLVKPCNEADAITIVIIKGKPGTIAGLDEGIWLSAKNSKMRNKNHVFVMSEAAFKVFEPEDYVSL